MNTAVDDFVLRARAVPIEAAAKTLGLAFKKSGPEHPQPCPVCGGKDRFAFNTAKNVWHCRGCSAGGRDAIGLAAHCLALDLDRRDGFLAACSTVLGEAVPEGGERESDADRTARLARIAERQRQAEAEARLRESEAADFRERERTRARGIYEAAFIVPSGPSPVRSYLVRRGAAVPPGNWLRHAPDQTYWHGTDELGRPAGLHSGPAMVAPFLDEWQRVIGCHITWIDLTNGPKFRPRLVAPSGEVLPTKKMRGSKKGGLIPLAGEASAERWVGAEGIENTLAYAAWEDFRADSFYFAAGDLGNLAGPAENRFAHPTLTKADRAGRERPVMVAGDEPKPGDAMWVAPHVGELLLLADGDSERVMTAAAMARARKRHARPGLSILVLWPRQGGDFAAMAAAETP